MTILGYDIDGQPLRAGDRVAPVNFVSSFWPPSPWTVAKAIPHPFDAREPCMEFVELDRDGDLFGARCCEIRKLPPKQADNETTTWESIEQLTGWVPEGVSHV